MKRTGFKQLTYAEAMAKQDKARERTRSRPAPKKKIKHPTFLGVKSTRYVGIKGCLWAIFSMYIRKRDFLLYGGRCVSCPGVLKDWKDGDAGHYISVSRGNFATLFHEQNVALQCKRCNNPEWTPDASIPFSYELDRRYGKGTAHKLYLLSQGTGKEFSKLEFERAVGYYKEKFDRL